MLDDALLKLLLATAARLSGQEGVWIDEAPSVQALPVADVRARACPVAPQVCANLVAYYDSEQRRILIDEEFNPADARDRSFIVHELVHVLERHRKGPRYHENCEATLASERLAYQAQNAYLREQGRGERFGDMLLQVACSRQQGTARGMMILEPVPRDGPAFDAFMDELIGPATSRR